MEITSPILEIKIQKSTHSKIHPFDKHTLGFGNECSDHMFVCDYHDGKWTTPEIIPFGNLSLSPATSFIHYGQAIFEGVKAYRQPDGSVSIFRPQENWKRMNVSAVRMGMPELPEEIFVDGMCKLIEIDNQWVPNETETSLYLRPFMIATDEFIGVRPSNSFKFVILASPAGAYFAKPVHIYVQNQYVRAIKGGIGFTKAAGNYGMSMRPTMDVKELGYDQILWTDAVEHKYVQEIGTMNVMFLINGTLITPTLEDGTILAGVTRSSVLELAKSNNIPVEERNISIDEIIAASKNGTLQEAFGTGTAASMTYISDLTYGEETINLPDLANWKIAPMIKLQLDEIRYGKIADLHNWMVPVKN